MRLLSLIPVSTVLATSLFLPQDPERPSTPNGPGSPPAASCVLCHSAAVTGLERSPHASLLTASPFKDAPSKDASCASCHTGAEPHALSAKKAEEQLLKTPPVNRTSCLECHTSNEFSSLEQGAHPWRSTSAQERFENAQELAIPAREEGLAAFDWSGLVTVGQRFVDRSGSTGRYRTDINLDRGFRLLEADVRGEGRSRYVDGVRASARDVEDPWMRVEADVWKHDRYRVDGRWDKRQFYYRAGGDFHRVDRDEQVTSFGAEIQVDEELSVFGGLTRTIQDGFWLTNRIGNRNRSPQTTIADVTSPRHLTGDDLTAGFRLSRDRTSVQLAFDWLDERFDERWRFDEASPLDPSVRETEDFRSRSTLRGPGGSLQLNHAERDLNFQLSARYRELERTIRGNGTRTGLDTNEFSTVTTSASDGDIQTFDLNASVDISLDDRSTAIIDLGLRDSQESLDIEQEDITTIPATNRIVRVPLRRRQRTEQTTHTISAELEREVLDGLFLSGGIGYAQETLRVPDLEAADNDFVRGTFENVGAIASVEWRPTDTWTLDARFTDVGQNSVRLHELEADDTRNVSARIRWSDGGYTVAVNGRHRRAENGSTQYLFESNTLGISFDIAPTDGLSLFGSWAFTNTQSRVLTTFWFDPDPDPAATLVGFDGETHVVTGGLRLEPSERVEWTADLAWTRTDGDFDVQTRDWRTDLAFEALPGGQAGLRLRRVEYDDGSNDFDADLLLLYWRQRFGIPR